MSSGRLAPFVLLALGGAAACGGQPPVATASPVVVQCPALTRWDGQICRGAVSCPASTRWDGTTCVGDIRCPTGSHWDGKVCVGRYTTTNEANAARSDAPAAPATKPAAAPVAPATAKPAQPTPMTEAREQPSMGKIDIFLMSDVIGGWAEIDGFPAPSPPGKTFILQGGDHIIRIGANGFATCRFTLRNLKPGQSITVHADLTVERDEGCGRIAIREGLGKMASF